MDAEQLAQQAAERVRDTIAEAERRAEEIVRQAEAEASRIRGDAEGEAERIRGAAEGDARRRLEDARRALDQLEGQLAGGQRAETQPGGPETPTGPPVPEPGPQPGPEPEPSPEPGDGGGGDEEAARLVAMKMAIDGKSRDEVVGSLDSSLPAASRERIVAEVFERAGR
jgi:hypothetical protein